MKGNEIAYNVMQISNSTILINHVFKGFCTTLKCVEKGLITYYTNYCWKKHLELQVKFALNQMRPCGIQRNLREGFYSITQETMPKTKLSVEKDS